MKTFKKYKSFINESADIIISMKGDKFSIDSNDLLRLKSGKCIIANSLNHNKGKMTIEPNSDWKLEGNIEEDVRMIGTGTFSTSSGDANPTVKGYYDNGDASRGGSTFFR